MALKRYQEVYESFPPVVVRDERGRPLHSWRVELVTYLDNWKFTASYDFQKPWNADANRVLASMVDDFHCPASEDGNEMTNYVALLRGKSAGDDAAAGSADEQVWAVVEIADSKIPWMAPRDIELDVFLERWKNGTWPSNHGSWWKADREATCSLLVFEEFGSADTPRGVFVQPVVKRLNLAMNVEEVKELLGLGLGEDEDR
jgi:hypothetical protein